MNRKGVSMLNNNNNYAKISPDDYIKQQPIELKAYYFE